MLFTRDPLGSTVRGGQRKATQSTTRAATVRELAQARGLDAPTGRLKDKGTHGQQQPLRAGYPRAWGADRERSASTHATRSKMGNCACECQIALRGARNDSCR
eukprot:6199988-Pleurochrysis_carterae.AAC.4